MLERTPGSGEEVEGAELEGSWVDGQKKFGLGRREKNSRSD
jgi:hypothetical protein